MYTRNFAARRPSIGVGTILLVFVGAILLALIPAWLIMLCIGGLHSGWIAGIPTIGFGSAFVMSIGLSAVGSALGISNRVSKGD